MNDNNIRWKRSVVGTRIGYILERFSHNGPPRSMIVDGVLLIGSEPVWVPVTMQDEEGNDTDTTLFVGTGEFVNIPTIKTEPENIFDVTLDSIENIEDDDNA